MRNILWSPREDAWVKIPETVRKNRSIYSEENEDLLIDIDLEILFKPVLSKSSKLFKEPQLIIY